MPHGRRTWICMRHYQSKPKSISGEFIRQKTPSNLTTTTKKKKKKNMRAGCFFFFQSQDTKALLIWKRLNPPNLILSSFNKYFNVNDGDQGILSHIRKRPQEEGVILSWNKKMMSSCPATDPGYRTARELTAPKANRAEDSSMCSGKHQITSYHDLQQKQGWGSRAGCEIG